MKRTLVCILTAVLLSGCSAMKNVGQEPELTPLGQGLQPNVASLPNTLAKSDAKNKRAYHGLWADGEQDFFRDPRAKSVGDVLTVAIKIDDKAKLDNSSERSRDASSSTGVTGAFAWGGTSSGDASASLSGTGASSSKGEGAIDRSEEIELSIAAVVTKVLGNGNLIISGQQEVRVNFEVRVLSVAGIVRPEDITGRNTIEYDKIAEARVSYGGRGRVTEVQQPSIGQQILDVISPL
ncbi:Flagellar L-ring protein precursor [Pseudovibrio axinellae]|uniref:Flagellar L-ring protein n=1 Tax=Pseudovibrio axinellae TaxID=989403 RepID=A0A165TY52_9HYPH|nr:flagellar basal body L-ring protein FlgH [Pseudovibrio axinellae]KZL08452.1 Flagellar L-ring protein precursor [Pseudovibrio axinellae]SEP74289.1 flagellar L-ring protein precursor FlgH [Pseudovibrio axinellae]